MQPSDATLQIMRQPDKWIEGTLRLHRGDRTGYLAHYKGYYAFMEGSRIRDAREGREDLLYHLVNQGWITR